MFRTIVTTLLMIEGGMFLSAGLAPGVQEMVQSTLNRYPELISADKAGEIISFFTWLRRLAMGFGLLCVLGGWGASQRTRWGRRAAVAASVGNLLLFLPIGVAGLIVLSK